MKYLHENFKMDFKESENKKLKRIKEIIETNEDKDKYEKESKLFLKERNVVIKEKHTYYKANGNTYDELRRIVNGKVEFKNTRTVLRED